MRIKRWASVAVAAGTLAGVAALPATTAQAAATAYNIHVGGDSAVSGVLFEGMRFLAPASLAVHKGDTITFTMDGFHTATLLPDTEQNPDTWRAQHQAGLTSDYSLIVPDGDDGATQFEFNNTAALPSDPTCGTATSPCNYDGKSIVNSGAPFASNSFTVTINDAPGASIWVICLIHPDMSMHISVVPDATTATTQAEIDSYRASTLAADHESAAALIPKLEKPTHRTVGGKVVWDAYAGFDQDGYGLDGMFPSTLHVKKGQTVRWHFSQLMGNIHTVTFPKSQAKALNGQFGSPVCEGATADTPPTSPAPPFCTDPTALELHVPGAALLPAGTHSYAGSGVRSSGVEGVGAPSMAPYDLRFTHVSNKKGFRYACIIHGVMMHGTVIVS